MESRSPRSSAAATQQRSRRGAADQPQDRRVEPVEDYRKLGVGRGPSLRHWRRLNRGFPQVTRRPYRSPQNPPPTKTHEAFSIAAAISGLAALSLAAGQLAPTTRRTSSSSMACVWTSAPSRTRRSSAQAIRTRVRDPTTNLHSSTRSRATATSTVRATPLTRGTRGCFLAPARARSQWEQWPGRRSVAGVEVFIVERYLPGTTDRQLREATDLLSAAARDMQPTAHRSPSSARTFVAAEESASVASRAAPPPTSSVPASWPACRTPASSPAATSTRRQQLPADQPEKGTSHDLQSVRGHRAPGCCCDRRVRRGRQTPATATTRSWTRSSTSSSSTRRTTASTTCTAAGKGSTDARTPMPRTPSRSARAACPTPACCSTT